MSCDAVAFSALLWLASTSPAAPPHLSFAAATAEAATPPSVAQEALFVDIVHRAGQLKAQAEAYENGPLDGALDHLAGFDAFRSQVAELATLDMQGHTLLAQRGYTDDLKCILKGISQDLPVKMQALESAGDAKARHDALADMFYLLRDNVEVITAPPQPAA